MSSKDQNVNILKKHASLFHAFIFLLAVIVAAFAAIKVFPDPIWQAIYFSVMSSVAAALMVVTLLFLLRRFFFVNHLDFRETTIECKARNLVMGSDVCGIDAVYDKKGNYGGHRDWINLIDRAVERVDIMGRSLYGWSQSADTVDIIVNKIVNDNVKFRWLFMHNENKFLPTILEEEMFSSSTQLTEKLETIIKLLCVVQDHLPEEKKDSFQVRQFKNVPLYFSILRIDDSILVNHYFCSTNSENSPLLHLKGLSSTWTRMYLNEFETIWKKATGLEFESLGKKHE